MSPTTPDGFSPWEVATLAHRLDGRTLLLSLPRLDPADLPTIRQEFAQWVSGSRRHWDSAQQAWNNWTGATPHRSGTIRYYPSQCDRCRGRRIDMRRGQVCHECMGRGRPTRPVVQIAQHLPTPDDA